MNNNLYNYDEKLVELLQRKVAEQEIENTSLREEVRALKGGKALGMLRNCDNLISSNERQQVNNNISSKEDEDDILREKYSLDFAQEYGIPVGSSGLLMRNPTPVPQVTRPQYTGLLNVSPWPTSDDQLRSVFNDLDTNSDGYLQKSEFMTCYRSFENYGAEEDESAIREKFSRFRSLGENRISFEEFCIIMLQVANR